ncbi:putative ATP-binding cassette protein [Pseudomassariella vexata]|uniref:Putative ATP-binding cassette protein n=1 Tax=Pseudomassariella vexata TaxID=1141098 RepID=A0A1Y2EJM6_9PEZI|nr:putative ATP-binding cassette protein [Pseudomassariella vexata]ORY71750.1 putative ATP-binding cassette protein [Pseudomassariella vexata]
MGSGAVRRAGLLPQRGSSIGRFLCSSQQHSTGLGLGLSHKVLPALPAVPPISGSGIRCWSQRGFFSGTLLLKERVIESQFTTVFTPKTISGLAGRRYLKTNAVWSPPVSVLRRFSATKAAQKNGYKAIKKDGIAEIKETTSEKGHKKELADLESFGTTEKASKAAQVNLRARLSKEGKGASKKKWLDGLREIWRLLYIARPELKYLGVAVVLLLISSAVTMSIPLSVGKIMDLATKGSPDEAKLFGLTFYQFFAALGAVLTVGATANFGRIILLRIIGERVVARLRSQLYRKTFIQDAEFFDANRVGDLISRLSADTIIVGKSITQNVSDGLRSIVSGIAGMCAMAWISPGLTTVILYAGPFVAGAAFFYARAIRRLSRDIQKNVGTLTKVAEERLSNVKTSQAFTGEIQEMHRYNRQIRKVFQLGKKESIFTATFFASTGWMGNMTILALLWFGGGYVRDGLMSLGDLTSFMMYTVFAGSSLFGVSGFFSELMKGAGAATRLFELQDRVVGIPPTKGVKVVSAQGPIKFSKVSFAYPTRPAVSIFNHLDFEIPSGSNVCVVGPSGGGKSTVASLLLRFYDPTSGTISINGVDISTMNVKSLRRRIGMVSQEPVLFSGTVAENIAYGRPKAPRSEIIAAAQKANCQFIQDFPQGLETQVGARGAQLSGGQKQRIAIARALLKDPDILILDEATSALDAESETLVNAALANLLKGRSTTISIAHRLSTIKRSDKIIVLSNDGTVAEIGPYSELSANPDSAFSKLMEWQMSANEVQDPRQLGNPHTKEIDEELEELVEEEEEEEDAEDQADVPSEEKPQK